MKIGLISDTRVPGGATEVPQQVAIAFEGVELILHAGGIHSSKVLDWLERIAPVKAAGRWVGAQTENPQPLSLEGTDDPRVAEQQILHLEIHTIGMVKNLELEQFNDEILPGVIQAHGKPEGSLSKIVEDFFGARVDIVVFWRTLWAMVEEHEGILLINPGSPTIPKNIMKLGTLAVLDLSPERRNVTVIDLAELR